MRIILNKEKRSFTFLILVKFIKKSQNKLAIFLRILYDIISEKSNISWRYKMKKTIGVLLILLLISSCFSCDKEERISSLCVYKEYDMEVDLTNMDKE